MPIKCWLVLSLQQTSQAKPGLHKQLHQSKISMDEEEKLLERDWNFKT